MVSSRVFVSSVVASLGCGAAWLFLAGDSTVEAPVATPRPKRVAPKPIPEPTRTPTWWDRRSKQQRLNDELVQTCRDGDERDILRLLRAGAQINGLSSSGYSPLSQAVEISSHASAASEVPNGHNPRSGDWVKFLLARGADPNAADRKRHSDGTLGAATVLPLEQALGAAHECSPQPAIVRALLRAGANPNAQFSHTSEWVENHSTPLGAAAIWGDALILRMLLRAGAEINGRDSRGRTPLMHAARTVDIWNRRHSSGEAMGLLLLRGAKVNARDDKGWTPLFYAVAEEGRDDNGRYELWGNANFEAVKRLLRSGARINARDKRGRTPLMWAASLRVDGDYASYGVDALRQDALVRLLIQKGAQKTARDINGRTARDLARRARNGYVLRALDKYRAGR